MNAREKNIPGTTGATNVHNLDIVANLEVLKKIRRGLDHEGYSADQKTYLSSRTLTNMPHVINSGNTRDR